MTQRFKRRMLNRLKRGLGDETFGDPNANAYVKSDQEIQSENRSRAAEPAPAVQTATTPAQTAMTPFQRPGVEFVEHDGKMVSADALNALKQTVGLLDQDLTYDTDGSGTVDLQDVLAFMKYGSGQDVEANTPFFSEFYKSETDIPVVVPDNGPAQAVTRAMGEHMDDQGNIVIPNFPIEATTMAMGEEEGSLPPFGGVTTAAVGEEGDAPPFMDKPPIATTMAMGEEEGSLPPFGDTFTTLAKGEEDGFVDPPIDTLTPIDPGTPVVMPRPDNPFFDLPVPIDNPIDTMPPVVAPDPRTYGNYTPPTGPVMDAGDRRTYGTTVPEVYSYTPVPSLVSAPAVDATAALDPLREGLGSFLRDGSANYLQSSGPRTSVFKRS